MNRRTAARSLAGAVLTTLLLGLCAGPAAAQAPASGRTASLLFLSTRTARALPLPPAALRDTLEQLLAGVLVSSGAALADPVETARLQRAHRIRSGQVISGAFLGDLRAEAGAGRLLVLRLRFEEGYVQSAGRLVDTARGLLIDAGTGEPEPWSGDGWGPAAVRSFADLAARLLAHAAPPAGEPLVILPVQGRGIEGGDVVTATHALLETVLARGGKAVMDPGVVYDLLLESGRDPRRLGRDGMAVLADSLGATRLLTTEIQSYDVRRGGGPVVFDDAPTALSVLPPFAYTARLTDLRSGAVTGIAAVYDANRPVEGWFGHVITRTSRQVLGEAAQRVWDTLEPATEDLP